MTGVLGGEARIRDLAVFSLDEWCVAFWIERRGIDFKVPEVHTT
jgi:hypothetical protein